jgi:hypothetical protein
MLDKMDFWLVDFANVPADAILVRLLKNFIGDNRRSSDTGSMPRPLY